MKATLFRFTFYAIIIYLTSGTLNLVLAADQLGNGTHFCGVIDGQSRFHRDSRQSNKRYSDQFPHHHYARSFAVNLNVGELRTVRLIYFTPNDWQYRADVVQKMKDTIRTVQNFYAEQMNAHGYGELTFRFETDSQGEPMVHHVEGRHPFSFYDNTLGSEVFSELEGVFDLDANIYFIVLGTDALRQGDGQPAGGVGYWRGKNGGVCLVPNEFSVFTVAHELGHTFGLNHDFRDNRFIMSYGFQERSSLSTCAAEFLSVHSYFNSNTPIEEEQPPTIELISPRTYPPGATSVPIRVQVSDSDGLHQVLLHAVGALQMCRNLTGEKEAIVEFEYDGGFGLGGFSSFSSAVTHGIRVDIVDTDGNVSDTFFSVVEISPYHITTLEGHTDRVTSVSFSTDNTTLASGSWDNTVNLWNVVTEENIATLWHTRRIKSVSFSPDGATLASGGNDAIRLWNVATQQNIATLLPRDFVNSVSFSLDGTTLASGDDYWRITLWNVATEENIAIFEGHAGGVRSVSLSRDGTTLASGSWDGTVKLWDVATQQNIATFEEHLSVVNSVLFSPVDATLLASGSWDGTVKLWNVTTQQEIGTLPHGAWVSSVSFSLDGTTLASAGYDGAVELWDVATGFHFATCPHISVVHSVSFSPDGGTLASGTGAGTVELWDTSILMEARFELRTEINIPGPNLRVAIAETIGLPSNTPILRWHIEDLTYLNARNTNISDLTGLEYATNLTRLWLWDNAITDISPVAGLIKLTNLSLFENNILDISPLAGLTNLTTLHLDNNSISDISPVANLTHLTELALGDNSISDISPVVGLTRLTNLVLWNNNISDISPVAGLTNLTTLFLDNNSISDISPLVANTGLGQRDTVQVGGNPLSYQSIHIHIPILQERGVTITFDNQAQPALLKISGDNQRGATFTSLSQPFVIEAQDMNGSTLVGISVMFAVTRGGGTLSIINTRTDANGRAQSTLILGPNLGTNTVQVSAVGIESPVTFYAISDAEAPPITADVNSDGLVNVLDLILIASRFGQSGQNDTDVNRDGTVSILDLVLAAGMFEGAAAAPAAHPQVPETLTAVEVQGWLINARSLEVRDATIKRGFLVLEQLLVPLTPTETQLLANYPNPFNPETWIPYRLAEEAFVTLTIYDLSGQVVRILNVGHRIASAYENRSKAIYWDGRNDVGERVASGVYFYTLTAGDYAATRKMVILK